MIKPLHSSSSFQANNITPQGQISRLEQECISDCFADKQIASHLFLAGPHLRVSAIVGDTNYCLPPG